MSSLPIENIAAYKFVDLDEQWIRTLRPSLRERCDSLGLKGTILLSPEGVNLFLSGERQAIHAFMDVITSYAPFSDLTFKHSFSANHSFRRMLVKVKKEIIPFGDTAVRPAQSSANRISPSQLKQWLDDGRRVVLLDTRNDYEVELGAFRSAIDLGLNRFRDFSSAVEALENRKDETFVAYCTGGIRCEKAALLMRERGFEDVYQLDGGILAYFEHCGGEHWKGECFVFDGRVAVDSTLQETDTEFCFRCQHILRPADMAGPEYEPGVRCPYCSNIE